MGLVLRELTLEDERAFNKTLGIEANFLHYYTPDLSYSSYVNLLQERKDGIDLPTGHVPSTLLFGFVDGEIVGRLSLRHELNDFLERIGGHIGYVVLPEYRRKGYATEMLRQSLKLAREKNLSRVLLTCDEQNTASRLTIEKCGGVYENTYSGPEAPHPKRRYWITLI